MTLATLTYRKRTEDSNKDELILSHLFLVRHILGKMLFRLPGKSDVENLEAAGVLGLVEAANNFVPAKGIKFKTFAYLRVRGAILDELRRNCPLPQHILERVSKIQKAYAALGPDATIEKLAEEAKTTPEDVTDCLISMRILNTRPLGEYAETQFSASQPDQEAERAERTRLLAKAIATLPERERLVITLYYLEDLRLQEIGRLLHLSESRVSRLLSQAMHQTEQYIRAKEA